MDWLCHDCCDYIHVVIWIGQYFYQIQKPDVDGTVVIEIPANATGAEIGEIAENKVITSPFVFRAALAVKGKVIIFKLGIIDSSKELP